MILSSPSPAPTTASVPTTAPLPTTRATPNPMPQTEAKSPRASVRISKMHPTIRAFLPTDITAVVNVLSQSMTADAISESRFVRQVLLDPNFRTNGAIVAERDNQVIGFVLAIA